MAEGVFVPGTLTVQEFSPPPVGDSMQINLQFSVAEADRDSADATDGFDYFIMAPFDINSKVLHSSDPDAQNNDDAWGLQEFTVRSADQSDADAAATEISLPSADNMAVQAGLIDVGSAIDGGDSLGSFAVTLRLSVNVQGLMTVESIVIIGQAIQADVVEDVGKAQVAFISNVHPTPVPDANSPDNLTRPITAAQLQNHHADDLQAIKDQYHQKPMIQSWAIAFDGVLKRPNSTLSKHVREKGRTNLGRYIFQAGEKLVAETPFQYRVEVDDYAANTQIIVEGDAVHGVLQQTAEGATAPEQ